MRFFTTIIFPLFLISSSVIFAEDNGNYETITQNILSKSSNNYKLNANIYVPGLFFGVASGDINFKVTDKMTIGPQVHFGFGRFVGGAIGLTMNYSLSKDKGIFSNKTWIINPYVGYTEYMDIVEVFVRAIFLQTTKESKAVFGGANLLYQWMWKNITMRVGGGGVCATGSEVNGCAPIGTLSVGFSI